MDLEAYALFQESMRQFLETQERVMRYQFGALPDSAQNGHGNLPGGFRTRIAPTPIPHAPSQVASEVDTGSASPKSSTAYVVTDIPCEPTPKPSREVEPVADTEASSAQGIRKPSTAQDAQDNVRPSASRDELMQQWLTTLLKIVEDRTGYPIEMLDPDAILEADLGIDSIKRVEIIAAFRRAELETFPEQPVGLMERFDGGTVHAGDRRRRGRPNSVASSDRANQTGAFRNRRAICATKFIDRDCVSTDW